MRKELTNRRPAYAFDIRDSNGTTYRLTPHFMTKMLKKFGLMVAVKLAQNVMTH